MKARKTARRVRVLLKKCLVPQYRTEYRCPSCCTFVQEHIPLSTTRFKCSVCTQELIIEWAKKEQVLEHSNENITSNLMRTRVDCPCCKKSSVFDEWPTKTAQRISLMCPRCAHETSSVDIEESDEVWVARRLAEVSRNGDI